MPSVSKKQHNFMAGVANNPAFAKKVGIPRSVGEEFMKADKGKTFKKGGEMNTTKMGKPVMKPGMSTAKDGMKKSTPMADTKMPAFAKGGFVRSADGIAQKGKTKAKQITMCGGGMAKKK